MILADLGILKLNELATSVRGSLVSEISFTGTPAENVDIHLVVHRSLSNPFVPIHRRIRKVRFCADY